jgi:hypothetical protein
VSVCYQWENQNALLNGGDAQQQVPADVVSPLRGSTPPLNLGVVHRWILMRELLATLAALAVAPCLAFGATPPTAKVSGTIAMFLHETEGHLTDPVRTASIGQRIIFSVSAWNVPSGTHEIGITIYDADGKEALRAARAEATSGGQSGVVFNYYFRKDDVPGTWWVNATIDGASLADRKVEVLQGAQQ